MHDKIGLDHDLLAALVPMHTEGAVHLLDCLDRGAGSHLDTDFAELFHEPADKLRFKAREHTLGSLQHAHLGAGASGDVRELGGDVAAAHHDDAHGKLFEFEEPVAGDHMLGPAECQRYRMRTSGNYDMPGLNHLFADRDRISPGEASFAVKRIDAALSVSPFVIGWHGIGESAFERNEFRQADPEFAGHAPAAHAPGHVNR